MNVLVFNQQTDVSIEEKAVKPVVEQVLSLEKWDTDEISVYFVTQKKICHLHQVFFNDPSPTDCISFPMDKEIQGSDYHILGEVFICPKTADRYVAKLAEVSDQECYRELTLYLVHGLLHLIGYDDINEKDRQEMRVAENKHMKALIRQKLLLKG